MSYSIIFQTKIVKLDDGRLIHFSRAGCNNDNEGRDYGDFQGKVYQKKDEFIEYAESFKKNSRSFKETEQFDLKIGNRYASYYDYGEHLLRMLKRGETYDEFMKCNVFRAEYLKGIELLEPEHKVLSPKEFNKVFYKYLYSGNEFSYRRLIKYFKDVREIVELLENDEKLMKFYIKKRR